MSLEIVSDKMFDDITKYGLFPRKTYGNAYVQLSEKLMKHFIRGYFDGDGCISTKVANLNNVNVGISGYYKNMQRFQSYLEKYNILSSYVIDNRKYNTLDNDAFGTLCFVNRTEKYCFLRFIYDESNIYLKRKHELAEEFIKKVECDSRPSCKEIIIYYKQAVQKILKAA